MNINLKLGPFNRIINFVDELSGNLMRADEKFLNGNDCYKDRAENLDRVVFGYFQEQARFWGDLLNGKKNGREEF